jgi:hypothetical protein
MEWSPNAGEVAFFHFASKTLIVADTIMNFEPERLRQRYGLIARLARISAPRGGMPIDMHLALWPKRHEVRAAFEQVLSWEPERIILSHGRCFDANGGAEVQRAFHWALRG